MYDDKDIDTMARTLWGEARGESDEGIAAVAWVIVNRANNPRWWGNDVASVCRAPWQFSCWNSNDPNLPMMQKLTEANAKFAKCKKIAHEVLMGVRPDPTGGADHYFNPAVVTPKWHDPKKVTAVVGNHKFLRLQIPAPVKLTAKSNTTKATLVTSVTGIAAVLASTQPVIELLGRLDPKVSIALIVVVALGCLYRRYQSEKQA